MRTRWFLGAVCLLIAAVIPCTPSAQAGPDDQSARADDAVARRVDGALARQKTSRLRLSIGVWDAATGRRIYGRSVRRPLRPASVMKLATTGAALLRLGPDHELATEIFADRESGARGGVATGLLVRGGGDLGLSGRFHDGDHDAAVRALARQVAAAGVRTVRGDLVLDDTAFSGPRRHPSWGHRPGRHEWWMAPVSALALNDNCIDVEVTPGRSVGAPAVLRLLPFTGVVQFTNELLTVAERKRHSIHFGAPDSMGRIRAKGCVWTGSTGYTAALACVDPVRFLGDVLRRALEAEGVTITGETVVLTKSGDERASDPPRSRRQRVARSATTVGKTVEVANTRSQNLFAEVLLRRLGQVHGSGGSFEGGADVVRETYGFEPDDVQFQQADGCGLSRDNAASAAAMGRILIALYDSPHRLAFMRSLAKPGDADGTLRKRLRGKRYEGKVLAKTGTLRDTSALAGYVRDPDGRVFAFAVLCEGDPSRSRLAQDAVVSALVGP